MPRSGSFSWPPSHLVGSGGVNSPEKGPNCIDEKVSFQCLMDVCKRLFMVMCGQKVNEFEIEVNFQEKLP